MTDPIVKTIEVACSAAEAFDVFVNRIGAWWPLDGHSASAGQGKVAQALSIEPRVGGSLHETMFDGTRDDWGKVLKFEPGRLFACTWHPGNNKDCPTQVEVAFTDLGAGRARVTLTHSGWEAWAERADEMRGGYNTGWGIVFEERYAGGCAALV